MNGQSGKFVGDLPTDKGKAVLFFLIAAVIGGVLGYLIFSDFLMTLIIAAIAGGITLAILWGQLKSVVRQSAAADYVNRGSVQIPLRSDTFLYRKTDKRPRNQSN